MIELLAYSVVASIAFVVGAAWGSTVTRTRVARYMYQHPDLAEAIRRAGRRPR